ncbi:MAG: filamentous hemagglutinin N-terminal domain-containing protein [Nitrospira sp.]|nr:filamentous hemagglutinin N-terminal domain-containing protein [Nitrospira sp.]
MAKSNAPSRHPAFMRQAVRYGSLLIVALILLSPSVGDAQIATDITSSGLNTQIDQVGNSSNITGGARPSNGPNLFHSFGNFSVGGGDLANFFNDTGLPTSNILSRVTGGNISNIDGTIQTTGFGSANLFLMNPSGIVLGPGASLNVGGSVSFTTAQYIRLFDGINSANFYANPANDGLANSILTINSSAFEFLSAAPAAHGFLTAPDPNVTMTVQGSALSVPSGQSISLVGGQVVIEGGAELSAPGGSIQLASAVSPGEFDVATLASLPNVDEASFASVGSVSLAPGSSIDVHGASTIWIKGGQLVLSMNDATLNTSESIAPHDTVSLSPGSAVLTSNSGTDPGANLRATVGNFRMDESNITTVASGPGNGGTVQLHAGSLTMENGASIVTATVDGDGVGGDVVLNVGTLSLMGGSHILSQSQTFTPEALGLGGHVIIQGLSGVDSAAESVTLSGDSFLSSSSFGTGEGGRVTIMSKSLIMDGAGTSVKAEAADVGRGGDIIVGVQQAKLSGGATINTTTGSADLNAPTAATVTVRGLSGEGHMADSVDFSGSRSGLLSDTQGTGRSGDVAVHAKTVRLTDGAVIETGTSANTGAGGNVAIVADSVTLSGEAHITSVSAAGNAGQVAITANQLTMSNVSIESSTSSSGRGGDVALNVGAVSLSNRATINSSTSAAGRAGDITMNVGTLSLAVGSNISSASTGTEAVTNPDGTTQAPGTAGNVVITAAGRFTSDASTIATSAEANHGGDVSITAHSVQLSNGTLITANSNAPLTVTQLVLDANGRLVEQVVGDGNAGNIRIESGSTFLMERSAVTTEAGHASGGQITINAPDMIHLTNSHVSTSVAGAVGDSNGGNISIDPDFVVLKGSQILAQAFAGSGGAIDITAGLFLADPSSIVDASSTLGVSGTVHINAAINNLSSVVAQLPESLLAVQTLLRAACAAKLAQGATSSFVERGRDGIPTGPDGLLASPYLPMTSPRSELRQAKPSTGISGIQLRRLFGKEMPSSVTLFSDRAACPS